MLRVICCVAGAVTGAIVMFALWLAAVLVRMPRPPVPPSFAVTLTAPVLAAVGFALGRVAIERLTRGHDRVLRPTFWWALTGGTVGTVVMFPLGGMMAGFGLFGLGTLVLLVREVLLYRDAKRKREGAA